VSDDESSFSDSDMELPNFVDQFLSGMEQKRKAGETELEPSK
jgi:hypothetical protein